jgi:hypothetical protein
LSLPAIVLTTPPNWRRIHRQASVVSAGSVDSRIAFEPVSII